MATEEASLIGKLKVSSSLFTIVREMGDARVARYAAIKEKYPEWFKTVSSLYSTQSDDLANNHLDSKSNQKAVVVNDSEWNWDLDFRIHSPEMTDPSRVEIEELLLRAKAFPCWPHENFRELDAILQPFDTYQGRYYIIPDFDNSPAKRMYDMCRLLVMALDEFESITAKKELYKNFNPMAIEGPYRFATEMHTAGVYVFRYHLRRMARPVWWNNLPADLQQETIKLCRDMSDYLTRTPPQKYGYLASAKSYAKLSQRAGCILL